MYRYSRSCCRTAQDDALYKSDETVQAHAEVLRRWRPAIACRFSAFLDPLQALASPGYRYLTLESLAAGLLCIRDIKTALNLSRPATCHDETFTPSSRDLRVARSSYDPPSQAPKAELRALPRQRGLSIDNSSVLGSRPSSPAAWFREASIQWPPRVWGFSN
jgi:hypothetical protein